MSGLSLLALSGLLLTLEVGEASDAKVQVISYLDRKSFPGEQNRQQRRSRACRGSLEINSDVPTRRTRCPDETRASTPALRQPEGKEHVAEP